MSSGPGEYEFEPESQGESLGLETSSQETETSTATTDENNSTATETEAHKPTEQEIKDNPAWKDILDPVPEHFHSHLKGHLSRMEKYAQEQQQQAAAYKEFTENNIPKESLIQGLQFLNLLNTNPKGVYDYLAQAYNFQQAQAAAQSQEPANASNQETLELGEEQPDIFKDPRVQQLANQAQFAQQAVEQMQQQQMAAQMQAQVDAELNAVQNHMQYKNLPMDLVIRTALGMAAETQARTGRETPADVMAAAKSLWETGAFASKPKVSAPPNLSGRRTGTPAESEPDYGKMTRQQRTAYVAEMMRQHES